jgi:hypothetical protein
MMPRAACTCVVAVLLVGALEGRQQAAFAVPASAPKAGVAAQASAPRAPWFGTWQLAQPAPASRFDPPPYKRVTLRIEPWEEGLRVVYDMVRARGGITHMEWTGRFDGRDYPVQGADYFLTNAYRLTGDRSYEIAIKVDTRVAATATAAVSPDGSTLTVTTVERDARGQTVNTTAVYRRIT